MKTLILLILIMPGFFTRSYDTNPDDEANKNSELAKQSFAAFNRHDWQTHAAFFSDSCKYLDPSYGTEYKIISRTEKAAKYKKMQTTSPDITDKITELFGTGNKVVIQFISSGTAKTDKGDYKWSLPICCVFTFKGGIIICDETYYDRRK
jgi:hypothetical protein